MARRKLEKRIKELQEELAYASQTPSKPSPVKQELGAKPKQAVVKAPPFKGTESEDFVIWLKNYDQICLLNGWEDDYKTIHIATVLQEDANRKYWECTEGERCDWDLLEKALMNKFSPESSRASFEAAFENRRRIHGETLDKFMTEIRSLARKAFPDWHDQYRDKMVKKMLH